MRVLSNTLSLHWSGMCNRRLLPKHGADLPLKFMIFMDACCLQPVTIRHLLSRCLQIRSDDHEGTNSGQCRAASFPQIICMASFPQIICKWLQKCINHAMADRCHRPKEQSKPRAPSTAARCLRQHGVLQMGGSAELPQPSPRAGFHGPSF